jgi:uncharacterized PurR-regulated membrane protein YhhQ (DUF165 family)
MIGPAIFVAATALANISISHFGPQAAPINAFVLIGLNLTLRDSIHDKWQGKNLWLRMLLMLSCAGVVSYLLDASAARIAIGSVLALLAAGVTDTAIYEILHRKRYLVRCNSSNVASAAVDSLVFFYVAFGGVPVEVLLSQWVVKVFGGGIWSLIIGRFRK